MLTNWVLTIAVLLPFLCVHSYGGYYWRDYTGRVPHDAYPAGRTSHGTTTYVGLVYLKEYGILPATINPSQKEVYAPIYGAKRAENLVQILCTDNRSSLQWIPTYKNTFTAMKFVPCGSDPRFSGTHYIGRANFHGEMIVGKVHSEEAARNIAGMFFVHNNTQQHVDSYEVLTYT